ncbi:MAG: hypothetical protein ACLR8P_16465 [Clostridium fessum]
MMHEAIQFCHEVKKLGYKVFAQAVSITSYLTVSFGIWLTLSTIWNRMRCPL